MLAKKHVELEDGTRVTDLKGVAYTVDLFDTFEKHAGFVQGVIGLVLDAAVGQQGFDYPVGCVLREAEDRMKALTAIAEELARRAGVKEGSRVQNRNSSRVRCDSEIR